MSPELFNKAVFKHSPTQPGNRLCKGLCMVSERYRGLRLWIEKKGCHSRSVPVSKPYRVDTRLKLVGLLGAEHEKRKP